jgi:hypothetical protein
LGHISLQIARRREWNPSLLVVVTAAVATVGYSFSNTFYTRVFISACS